MEKVRVIIADDVEIQRSMLKNIVEKINNFEIVGEATNGKEEYDLIKEIQPQLVLTDNQMPILNGIDVIKNIRNDGDNETKFIIITGDRDIYEQIKNYNIFKILYKPFNGDDLKQVLEEFIFANEITKDKIIEKIKVIKEEKKSIWKRIFKIK